MWLSFDVNSMVMHAGFEGMRTPSSGWISTWLQSWHNGSSHFPFHLLIPTLSLLYVRHICELLVQLLLFLTDVFMLTFYARLC